MQVPVTMDQVALKWDGGHSVLLTRVQDGKGCWLCRKEVHRKLGSSRTVDYWNHCTICSEHM